MTSENLHSQLENQSTISEETNSLSFIDHLAELRSRLLICFGFFMCAFILALWRSENLIAIAMAPIRAVVPDIRLSALTVTEAFVTTIKLAAVAALVITSPIMVWQAWRFVEPGLLPKERFWCRLILLPVMIFFLLGTLFCYYVILPAALNILLHSGSFLNLALSFAAFVEFEIIFLLVIGILFELPIVIVFLDATGICPLDRICSHRRHIIVVSFILGAIFSPPDVFSQLLVAIPLIILTELGLILAYIFRSIRQSSS